MADTNTKPSRLRSPAYPLLDLKEAVEKLELLHSAESLHHVSATVAAKHIGYEPGSSRGWRAIASLTSFGLLDEEGSKDDRMVWLSELGKEIVHFGNKDSEEAKAAIKIAALKPAIHNELWEKWLADGESLPSNDTMKRTLVKEKEFNPKSVDSFIQEFINTLTYAGLINGDKITSSDNISENRNQNSGVVRNRNNTGGRMTSSNLQDYPIPLVGGSTAILSIPRPMSKKNFELIKNWLTIYEPSLTEDENQKKQEEDERED